MNAPYFLLRSGFLDVQSRLRLYASLCLRDKKDVWKTEAHLCPGIVALLRSGRDAQGIFDARHVTVDLRSTPPGFLVAFTLHRLTPLFTQFVEKNGLQTVALQGYVACRKLHETLESLVKLKLFLAR